MNQLTLLIPADHATSAGHFPSNPIIPGALLLAEVLGCIEKAQKLHFVSYNIRSAKFQYPVRPGDCIMIDYSYSTQGQVNFHCAVAGIRVMSGIVGVTAHE